MWKILISVFILLVPSCCVPCCPSLITILFDVISIIIFTLLLAEQVADLQTFLATPRYLVCICDADIATVLLSCFSVITAV